MSKHLHTLRAITLCITALLGTAHSSRCQTPNVICDVTEFCYCFDGVGTPVGQNPPTMSFTLCSDSIGSNLTVLFCSGQTPPGGVIRGYDGLDNTGTPISSLTGGFLNLQGVIGTANTTSSISIAFDFDPSPQSCASGNYAPIRFFVLPTGVFPYPVSGDCTGSGPDCGSTGITAQRPNPTLVVDPSGRIKLPDHFNANGELTVLDAGGRILRTMRLSANAGWLYLGDLGAGIYMARITGGADPIAFRVVVPE